MKFWLSSAVFLFRHISDLFRAPTCTGWRRQYYACLVGSMTGEAVSVRHPQPREPQSSRAHDSKNCHDRGCGTKKFSKEYYDSSVQLRLKSEQPQYSTLETVFIEYQHVTPLMITLLRGDSQFAIGRELKQARSRFASSEARFRRAVG
jgi:hypothetical protein